MSEQLNDNQLPINVLERENQRLRGQLRALQQLNETLECKVVERTQELQETEARLQRLAGNLPGVIFQSCLAADRTLSFLFVSEGSREIFELEPENFLQLFELVPESDREALDLVIQNSASSLSQFCYEHRIITRSGTLKWVQVIAKPERQDDGVIIWDGIIIDISDRKRIEKEQQRLLAILEATPDIIGIGDDRGNGLYLNRAGQELLEIPAEKSDGFHVSACHPPDINQILETEAIPTAIQTGIWQGESRLCSRSGREFPVSQVILAHYDDAGNVEYMSTIMRDISDRKQIEAALSASEERFRLVCEQTGQLVYEYDIASGNVIWAGAMTAITGYSATELSICDVNDWENFIHPDDRVSIMELLEAAIAECSSYHADYRWRQKDGSYIYVEDNGIVLKGENGQPYRMLGTVNNISQRKATEEELILFKRAVESSTDAIALADPQGNLVYQNPAHVDLYKCETLERYREAGGIATCYPDRQVYQEVIQALLNGRSWIGETEQDARDGRRFPAIIRANGIRSESGELLGLLGIITDLSDLKAIEAALSASEERFRLVCEQTGQLVYDYDIASGKIIWAGAIPAITGYSAAEFRAFDVNDWEGLIHPDDRDRVSAYLDQTMAEGSHYRIEYRWRQKDETYIDVEDIGVFLTNEEGEVSRMLGTTWNIGDRKTAERALQKSESLNRYLFEEFPIGLVLCRMNGELVHINSACANTIGRTIEEALELTYWDITPIKYADREAEQLESLRTTGRYGPYEKEYIHKDGRLIPVVLSGLVVEIDGESMIWSSIADISDRKADEERLRQSEERFRGLVETLNDWIWECDVNGIYTYVSPQIERILGYTPEEAIGKTPFDFMAPAEAETIGALFAEKLSIGEAIEQIENINLHKDGHRVVLETSGVPIFDGEGNLQGYRGVDRDISDRKAAEERLRQQEAQYRQIFETIIDGLGIIDLERGKLVEVNPAYHQMHGYSYQEFLTVPFTTIVHPNSFQLLTQFITELQAGRVFTCRAQNIHRNSQIIDVDVKGVPFPYQGKNHALVLVRDISEKVKFERDRDRQEQALRSIVEGTAAQTGEEFFRACVKSLAEALDVTYVLISEIELCEDKKIARVLAFWMGGDFGESFQYDLHTTPCHNVFEDRAICRYPNSVQTCFPEDLDLVTLGAESYIGIPLVDARGIVIGLIAALDTKPMAEDSEMQVSILEIFAARAGAEIERMRSEQALREKDRILQLTLKAGKMGCWSWNTRTNEVLWSDGVEALLGLEPGSFNNTFEEYITLVHSEDRPLLQQILNGALEGEEMLTFNHRIVRPDGKIRWLAGQGERWRDNNGEIVGLMGSVLDDTQRKNAEVALIESAEQISQQARQEQLLNQIANQIRNSLELDRILETTVREIRQFLEVDRCHFAWYVREDDMAYWDIIAEVQNSDLPSFVGKHPTENFGVLSEFLQCQNIIRLDDVTVIEDLALQQTLAALGNKSMLVLPISAESTSFGIIACIHHQTLRPWRDEEVEFLQGIVAQVAIAINQAELLTQSQTRAEELEKLLTKFQRTQTQLIQSEKMSSLGQMVAGVAHEINNPVNFIHGNLIYANEYLENVMGLLDLYQEYYPEPHPDIEAEIEAIDLDFLKEDAHKIFQSMRVGTDRISAIVKSLRTFSRLDESEVKNVNLHEGIDSTLMILQTRLRAQNWRPEIAIVKEYSDLPKVQCYAGQLNQVFMNIISNAIDALEDRDRDRTPKEMQENPSQIRINTRCTGDAIVIAISDNGRGISAETQAKLFDPFFTTKPVGKGTGMGLSISYQIIAEKHKGKLSCNSQPGQTTFTIEIPIGAEHTEPEARNPVSQMPYLDLT
ncbi:PAS domain S-box protein [Roseofilum casamattae]|uniref:histidine kinase n=1 Tax=Roseofilum casamattae BLCC-M143 TaxID=3022442 RepID=A0ABT7BZ14_9CYAN|nr:PAS domain S-box protein [Roseofilum casamattae]MDJ1183518.1 PAS domain S-box protein [Roseofilum casamattae BLCC-M143]